MFFSVDFWNLIYEFSKRLSNCHWDCNQNVTILYLFQNLLFSSVFFYFYFATESKYCKTFSENLLIALRQDQKKRKN